MVIWRKSVLNGLLPCNRLVATGVAVVDPYIERFRRDKVDSFDPLNDEVRRYDDEERLCTLTFVERRLQSLLTQLRDLCISGRLSHPRGVS